MIIKVFHLPNNNWSSIREEIELSENAKFLKNYYAIHRVSDYAFAVLSRHPDIDLIVEKYGGRLADDVFRINLKDGMYPYIHGNEELVNSI
jgi:hypothetical protein